MIALSRNNKTSVSFCILLILSCWAISTHAHADFLVAIDIGHTPNNPGATSARGIKEYTFNKKMVLLIEELIKKSPNISSFVINKKGGNITLKDRTAIAANRNANLLLSIHHDSVQPHYMNEWIHNGRKAGYSDNFYGFSIFLSNKNPKNKESQLFAILLGEQLLAIGLTPTLHHSENIPGENRKLLDKKKGVYVFDDLVVLKTATMPAVLLECGIIVNRKEELLVSGFGFKTEVAKAIVNSIFQYIELSISRGDS